MVRVYIDIGVMLSLAGSTFVLDAVTLWAVGQIRDARVSMGRVTAGAAFTSAAFMVCVFLRDLGVIDIRSPLSMGAALAASLVALRIAFPGIGRRELGLAMAYRYLLAALACGIAVAVKELTAVNSAASTIVAAASVLVVAEAGWGAVHRGIRHGLLVVPVTVCFGGQDASFSALVDTGNRLRDPISGAPAIIVELEALKSILPCDIFTTLMTWDHDMAGLAEAMGQTQWSWRFRAVPYSSIGKKKGIMAAFRPDRVTVEDGVGSVITSRAIVCVYCSDLSSDRRYRALVNPDIFSAA